MKRIQLARVARLGVVVAALTLPSPTVAKETGTGIFVNGVELSAGTLAMLKQSYGIRIADAKLSEAQLAAARRVFGKGVQSGRFWYDRVSGAWGYEGMPAMGQVLAGLPIGGRLRANASGGGTPVVVNGRILHPAEVRYLMLVFGTVVPGRYFLLPDGSYGFEGGPVTGSLAPPRGSGRFAGRDKFGSVIGGDDFVGYLPPSSGGVGVTCAPDGGCIYD